MKQLLTAVSYLHGLGIYHRDIKTKNIFYNLISESDTDSNSDITETEPKMLIKLGDFGAADYINLTNKCVGTPYNMAPEMILEKAYDQSIDIWACGIVMFIMLYHREPWISTEKEDLIIEISNFNEASFREKYDHSILNNTIRTHPKDRLTADQLLLLDWFEAN